MEDSNTQSSYAVAEDNNGESYFHGDYGDLHNLPMDDESVSILSLPFEFPFFEDSFNNAVLSSNGLMSFHGGSVASVAPSAGSAKGEEASFGTHKKGADMSVLNDDTYIVVLRREMKESHLASVAKQVQYMHDDVTATDFTVQVQKVHSKLRMMTVHAPSEKALKYLTDHEHVLSVQPNRAVSIVDEKQAIEPMSALTSSPYSWGLDRIDQVNLPLDQATYTPHAGTMGGAGVDVYVVDTGLDTTHVEFANTGDRTVSNVFNGYGDLSPNTDVHGHGSHCAGTVGGVNVGVAPKANIFGLKVLGDDGYGSTAIILDSLDFILDRRVAAPTQPMVVSMSLGGDCGSSCATHPMNIAVDELSAADVTVVVAAGNSGADACTNNPASANTAVTVGSTTNNDGLSSFSSIGSCVDILAPGSSIVSVCASSSSSSCAGGDSYVSFSGTSMACPHTAGVTALWLAQTGAPGAPPPPAAMVKNVLQCNTVPGVISMWDAGTVNLLLQVPSVGVTDLSTATCTPDGGCSDCSGENKECSFGLCSCSSGWFGDNCDVPGWAFNPHCCSGGSMGSVSDPFNTIAFLWTDLHPGRSGNVYYGTVNEGETYAVVFDHIPSYSASSCYVTVEVLLHSSGSFEIIYVDNDIGSTCDNNVVSVGIKGKNVEDKSLFQFQKVYGRTRTKIPSRGSIRFVPLAMANLMVGKAYWTSEQHVPQAGAIAMGSNTKHKSCSKGKFFNYKFEYDGDCREDWDSEMDDIDCQVDMNEVVNQVSPSVAHWNLPYESVHCVGNTAE